MFVRVKTTSNSPRKSVQIVQSVRKGTKISQKIVRHIGIAMDEDELKQLKMLAETIKVKLEADNQKLLFSPEEIAKMHIQAKKEKQENKEIEESYKVDLCDLEEEQRVISGIHDIYGKLFDNLGCNSILKNPARNKASVEVFKNITLARIANPQSKRSTVNFLEENYGVTLNLDQVYKMMDKLDDTAINKLNETMYKEATKLFGGKIDVVFFDCTTLYFESFSEDEFRKNGYSKDLKFNQPQVLIALMVTKEGLPLGYKAFAGDTYEGHTLIPALKELKEKYNLDKIIYVAYAGMFNKNNIMELETLEEKGFEYIVGARLKNMTAELQKQILDLNNYRNIATGLKVASFDYQGRKLIVSYSEKRAKKDAYDRNKAIEKLKKKLEHQKNPKSYLSNYGYKKYLKVEGENKFCLNEEKIQADSKWDGLHGMVTNSERLSNQEILDQYKNLWQVEEAFRITKHELKVRPIFHWKPNRVKAHLAISFTAYALVKHLAYRVKLQYKSLSPEKIRQYLVNVQTSIFYDRSKKIRFGFPSKISLEAEKIYKIMDVPKSKKPWIIKNCSA